MSHENSMGILPDGWSVQSLSLTADVVMGQSPPGASYNEDGVGAPFFQGKTEFGQMYPTVRKWTTAGNKHARVGDILLSVRAPVGPTNVADIDCVIGRGLAAIRAKNHMNQVFLLWFLRSFEHEIAAKGTGTTFDSISSDALRNQLINVPPMEEQEKIVEILEEQLSRLDAALASVRLVREKAVRFRRSLLHAAFTGALTEGWRQLTLNEACELITDGSHFSPATVESGMPYITVRDLGESGIDFLNCKFITRESFSELARNGCQPLKNDVLFSKDGTVGKVALVNDEREFVVLSSLAIVRPSKDVISSSFLKLSMQSPSFLETALGLKTGTALRRIVLRNLKTVKMAVPSLKEQEKIVGILEEQLSRLGAALSVADAIEKKISAARRSLLHAASTGNLTKEWREGAHV